MAQPKRCCVLSAAPINMIFEIPPVGARHHRESFFFLSFKTPLMVAKVFPAYGQQQQMIHFLFLFFFPKNSIILVIRVKFLFCFFFFAPLRCVLCFFQIFYNGKGYGVVTPDTYRKTSVVENAEKGQLLLMSDQEALTRAHGAVESFPQGNVVHKAIQTNLVDVICRGISTFFLFFLFFF
jgi:hypothetical protein